MQLKTGLSAQHREMARVVRSQALWLNTAESESLACSGWWEEGANLEQFVPLNHSICPKVPNAHSSVREDRNFPVLETAEYLEITVQGKGDYYRNWTNHQSLV